MKLSIDRKLSKGKSEFLKHDLLPAALRTGYAAAYTNLCGLR
jgi:hypothetical protein